MIEAFSISKNYEYTKSMQEMATAQSQVLSGEEPKVLAYEYRPVLTLGRRLSNQKAPSLSGIEVVKTDRGGEATFHNPGQLVIYPIVNVREKSLGVRDFVCLLEKTTMELLDSLGVNTFRVESKPGLFTEQGKIMSIGLRLKNGVSTHGISININNDLSSFSKFTLCGTSSPKVDRISNHKSISTDEFYGLWVELFSEKLSQGNN